MAQEQQVHQHDHHGCASPHYWDEARGEWTHEPPAPVQKEVKIGRNDLCICGSGKKYKKCCLAA